MLTTTPRIVAFYLAALIVGLLVVRYAGNGFSGSEFWFIAAIWAVCFGLGAVRAVRRRQRSGTSV